MTPNETIAVIGAGQWGRHIVKTLHSMGRLAAVAEQDAATRERLAREYPNIPVVEHYRDLPGRADVGAWAIATPVATHHRTAMDAMAAGMDVFVEKPLALTVAEAEELVATANSGGRILMVGHLLLYKPAMIFIKDWLSAGHLGRVFTLHQQRAKLGKARTVENVLWSFGVHDVAVLLYLTGESPVQVAGSGHCGLQPHVADDYYLHLLFADGRTAHLHNSWLWPEDQRRLVIIGERGMLIYDEKKETVTLARKTINAGLHQTDEGSELIFHDDSSEPLRLELEHFAQCLASRCTPRTCGRTGLEVIRVLEQAA